MKKASMELSVNFLVVMILCIVLMGVGIALVVQGQRVTGGWQDRVSEEQKKWLQQALDDGALVFAYPSSGTIDRGKFMDFSVGIRNKLESSEGKMNFCISVTEDSENTDNVKDPQMLYSRSPISIKTNEQVFKSIRIIIPKEFKKDPYLFNVDVTAKCNEADSSNYGDRQKLQVNVR